MLTFNNAEVHRTLSAVAEAAYPNDKTKLRSFRIDVRSQESASRHGDYHPGTAQIRIFNLSRKPAHIIKTTVHELAHHVQCCFEGKTGHDRGFYTIYKHLLETAHRLGFIDLAETTDQIDSRDLANMAKLVGAPSRPTPVTRTSTHIIKVSDAFSIKDDLKAHGYEFSSTEKAWIHEVEDSMLSSESQWISTRAKPEQIRIVKRSDNVIESVYFCIVGKSGVFQHIDALKSSGYRFDSKVGWYKRIPAIEKSDYERAVMKQFNVAPRFRGKL